jgi:hypothetical protein
MVKNFLLVIPIFLLALIGFMPKEQLYYKLEEQLQQKGIVINEGSFSESFFTLTIENAEIFTKGIKVATIDEISLFTLLLYSKISIENVTANKSMAAFIPKSIESVTIGHRLWVPKILNIDAKGSFGNAEGKVSGSERLMRIEFFETTNELKKIKNYLKKDENGWYYETTF